MSFTDDQVAERRAKVESLRTQVADLKNEREQLERDDVNATVIAQLDAEERELNTELDYQNRLKIAHAAQRGEAETAPPEQIIEASVTPVAVSAPVAPTDIPVESAARTTGKVK